MSLILQHTTRWVGRLERFLVCAGALGFRAAYSIFLQSRNAEGTHSLRLPHGPPFFYRRWDSGALTHFYLPGAVEFDAPSAGGITRVLDAGANIGAEAVRFLTLYPRAEVVSVEIEPGNFALLQRNVAWAGARAHCIHGALWPEPVSALRIETNGDGMEAFRVLPGEADERPTVRGYSVAEMMDLKGWAEIDLLKVDIEGAEKMVFESMTPDVIRRVRCLIVEPHDVVQPGTMQALFDILHTHHFRSFIVGENIVSIRADLDWTWRKDRTLTCQIAS